MLKVEYTMLLNQEESKHQTKLFGKLKLDNASFIFPNLSNTVFARALVDGIQRSQKDYKNEHAVDKAITLCTQCLLYLCYFPS